jgi:hypothetical protein
MARKVKRAPKLAPPIKPDGWELNSGLFEVYWKNNVAIRVAIAGVQFTPVGTRTLRRSNG